MSVSAREAAELLDISESTLYRWFRRRHLPACFSSQGTRVNRVELLEWATDTGAAVSPDLLAGPGDDASVSHVVKALRAGGVHYDVPGDSPLEVLRSVAERSRPATCAAPRLFELLAARQRPGWASPLDGVATPHPRSPVVLELPAPRLTLSFLASPVCWAGDADVRVLFTLLSPTVHAHHALLAHLAFTLRQEPVRRVLRERPVRDEVLGAFAAAEDAIPSPHKACH